MKKCPRCTYQLDPKRKIPQDYEPVSPLKKNSVDLIGTGRKLKRTIMAQLEQDASDFGRELCSLIVKDTLPDPLKMPIYMSIEAFGHQLFKDLSKSYPSLYQLTDRIRAFCNDLENKFGENFNHKDKENYYKLMHIIWKRPIQPYITTSVLRYEAARYLKLLRNWKDSVNLDDGSESQIPFTEYIKKKNPSTNEEEWDFIGNDTKYFKHLAEKNIEKFAQRANDLASQVFPATRESEFFCKEVYDANKLDELRKILYEEGEFSFNLWQRRHHAYVKISLIYALLMIEGKIDRDRIEYNAKRIFKKLERITYYYGEDPETKEQIYILNPEPDGSLGKNSILINNLTFNTKEDLSLLLKFLLKVLDDKIAPNIDDIRDLIRGRIQMLKDTRKSHPSLHSLSQERAEIAAATKILGIVMTVFGNSIDRNSIKQSIEGNVPINENSTNQRLHRAVQQKFSIMIDSMPDGRIKEAGENTSCEMQIRCYVPSNLDSQEIAEYINKKANAAMAKLGIFNFDKHILHMCEVFINRFEFDTLDDPEQRVLHNDAYPLDDGQKRPYEKENIAREIIEAILSYDSITQENIDTIIKDPNYKTVLCEALEEIQKYFKIRPPNDMKLLMKSAEAYKKIMPNCNTNQSL
ncbi:hypothetical protein JW911_03885 [Candidatus Peregrinibacteria bacterium]|nr:hypothetical protein [Candidatus Peregrinibacteria bacterium]